MKIQVFLTLTLLKGPLQRARGRIPLVHNWRKRWSSCGAFQTARRTRELHMTTSKGLSQFPDHEKIQVVYTSGDKIIRERITESDTKQWAHNRRMRTHCTGMPHERHNSTSVLLWFKMHFKALDLIHAILNRGTAKGVGKGKGLLSNINVNRVSPCISAG